MPPPRSRWVLLSYRVPREPSTPRISVWRTLRRLGVARLNDGLVALPLDARTREQLEWVAEDVVEADGEASIWIAEPGTLAHERAVVDQLRTAVADEYRELIASATKARTGTAADRRRALARLRRELRAASRRDYFAAQERQQASAAIEALAAVVSEAAA